MQMKISAFTMCRNADKLYYPIKESILSALPLVNEYVVAIGKSDEDDRTLEIVKSIDSDKIKIIETEWDVNAFPNGTVHAQQTDLAKSHCTGDWLLYLQADEVLHEQDHQEIKKACARHQADLNIEGFLFKYHHFWGDYDHVVRSHGWYSEEIRIIRNTPEIHSWQSAQSFRYIPNFDGKSYRTKEGTRKLKVKKMNASIYHYGWVRPPEIMTAKMNALDKNHSHELTQYRGEFDFGDMRKLQAFNDSHPQVMEERIQKMNWKGKLNFSGKALNRSFRFKHERARYKILSWIESQFFGGRQILQFKNWRE